MRRLLLIDDERYVVDWLYEMFSREAGLDLEICKAYSAQEALEWLSGTRIDVVLSDIKMPGMSGLELMERIRRSWPLCRIILLTGYRSFDYIYQADKYPAVTYLLKTEDDDVILDAVRVQLQGIEEDLREQKLEEESSAKTELLAQSILLGGVAKGRIDWKSLSQADFGAHGLTLRVDKPFLLVSGRFCGGANEKIQQLVPMYALMKQYMSEVYRLAQWSEDGREIFWILQPLADVKPVCLSQELIKVYGILEDIQQASREILNVTVSFVLDHRLTMLCDLKNRTARLSELSHYRLVSEEPVILMTGNMREGGLDESSQRQLINNIKKYVRSNLNGDLSLTVISDQVFYNASYISRVFKRIEGINFTEFVMLERLNKACVLLAGDSGTINEISFAVGFESPQYFATVFKKHTECTPNQYKESMRKCRQIEQK